MLNNSLILCNHRLFPRLHLCDAIAQDTPVAESRRVGGPSWVSHMHEQPATHAPIPCYIVLSGCQILWHWKGNSSGRQAITSDVQISSISIQFGHSCLIIITAKSGQQVLISNVAPTTLVWEPHPLTSSGFRTSMRWMLLQEKLRSHGHFAWNLSLANKTAA